MSLTSTLDRPLGAEPLPSRERQRKLTDRAGRPERAPHTGAALAVSVRSAEHFEPYRPMATAPERYVVETTDGVTLWFHMRGAGAENTEVVWDPEQRQLHVGAWSRRVDRVHESSRFEPRLLWHTNVWRPECDGALATASVGRGWVRAHLPRCPGAELEDAVLRDAPSPSR